ncbi:amidohydrolase family protein [Agromyces sp. H3Y2-19a]|uniref:amidohydrolase family protein n=1 Tax=Agromyces chromiiresistens TaxID=3030835 RepID=UPI0023B9C90A|nr:amidohydrolase family protein [Agromyces chromiiresistens]MDF0515002.1 amidohydrolase family protein [Agromyces chromiiresistens]
MTDTTATTAELAGDHRSATGIVAAPGLVDAHIHPDKSSWGGPWMSRRRAGSLPEFIANDLATQRAYTRSVEERAHALLSTALAQGTLAMRAHVDVSSELGTRNVEGVRAAAERLAPWLTVQIVAFPQFGLLTNPGTVEAMAAALDSGADLVGGIDPLGLEGDVDGHLDTVFGLAERAGREIDIHLHDGGEPGLAQIREIARRTRAAGLQGRVTVSHAFALGDASLPTLGATLDTVADAGVWIANCALGDDPVPDLDQLGRHGVRLVAGSDGVRDSWTPFGSGSMVDRAHLLAYRTGAMTDDELERCYRICSTEGASLIGVPDLAEFSGPEHPTRVEFAGESIAQIVVDRPGPVSVIRDGLVFDRR